MRNRLLAGVALCSVAVVAAGVPGLIDSSGELSDSQDLVELAELNLRAITLSHALADERQSVLAYVAEGRDTGSDSTGSDGLIARQRARVDRQLAEFRAQAPDRTQHLLGALPERRRQALAGDTTVDDAQQVYGALVQTLNGIAAETARALPARAQAEGAERSTAEALPFLVRAVEQASVSRDLLSVALVGTGPQNARATEAHRAYLREQAALADFQQLAADAARDAFTETVNGHDVALAERYLTRLTDQSSLSPADRALSRKRVEAALSARIDLMRSVASSLSVEETARLKRLRDDDVTAWEIRIALLVGCLLFAVGASVQAARSMTRPLAVLRLGSGRVAADPVGEEPVAYTGRDDEFAEVVRAVNQLRETAVALHERTAGTDADRTRLVGTRDRLAAEREALVREYEEVRQRLVAVQSTAHGAFAQLGTRTAELIERQLATVRSMREREADPARLDALAAVDRLTVRMWRHSANLLLLAEAEHTAGETSPWPLATVLSAAVDQIEGGDRVRSSALPAGVQVSGALAVDLRRVIAELLDNAVSFSPADTEVALEGQLSDRGELVLRILDQGIGMTTGRMAELNGWFTDPGRLPVPSPDGTDVLRVGLYVVARLAARHQIQVRLSARRQGGIAAEVVLAPASLAERPVSGAATVTGEGGVDPALAPRREVPEVAPTAPFPAQDTAHPDEPGAVGTSGTSRVPAEAVGPPAPAALALSADPLIAAAERAEQAARELRATDELALGPVEDTPRLAASDELADEVSAPDVLVRAAGPYLVEQNEHGRAAVEDDLAPLAVDTEVRPAAGDAVASAPAVHALDDETSPAPRAAAADGDSAPWPAEERGEPTVSTGGPASAPEPLTAEELRQRLGGLQQGARNGRRDAAAELTVDTDRFREHRGDARYSERSGGQCSDDTVEERPSEARNPQRREPRGA